MHQCEESPLLQHVIFFKQVVDVAPVALSTELASIALQLA
jgi:hypothetical protein